MKYWTGMYWHPPLRTFSLNRMKYFQHGNFQIKFLANNQKNRRCMYTLYRGSYMNAHVLLNLLNPLGKTDKMRGLPSILSLFRNEFNKFNKTRARMWDSIYHMTLRLL